MRIKDAARFLPNPDTTFWVDEQLIFGLHLERVIPGVDISHHTVDPILPRRMRVAHDLAADGIIAQLTAPCLRPPDKNTLLAGQSVDYRRRFAFERRAIGIERYNHSTEIGDVLAH